MPVTTSYPGIYIQELPSSSHSITAASTNLAVFVGYTHPLKTASGNWGRPVEIFGFMDYQRQFGGLLRGTAFAAAGDPYAAGIDPESSFGDMAQAVNQFFLNSGTQAYVVAVRNPDLVLQAPLTVGSLTFTAKEIVDDTFVMTVTMRPVGAVASPPTSPPADALADIVIRYGPASGAGAVTETYRLVSMAAKDASGGANPDYVVTRLAGSQLVEVTVTSPPGAFPPTTQTYAMPPAPDASAPIFAASHFAAAMAQDGPLDKLPVFNLMVIPGVTNALVLGTALAFCERKRAFFVMDPPITASADGTDPTFPNRIQDVMAGDVAAVPAPPHSANAALYFPYLKSPDPFAGTATNAAGHPNELPPAASVAGVFAATDLARGVWKAPAGFQATTKNTTGVAERGRMTDMRQGTLNPVGVNCLRDFANVGTAVFGARTLVTETDEQWRYVPVRRMALFLEQSLYASLGWAVFEPNAEPLWSAITMSVNAFMLGLFRQGAFAGVKPGEAFSVQCNSQTTTQQDIDQGVVNIVVAFAPLKPAEFVVITIAQLAGQAETG